MTLREEVARAMFEDQPVYSDKADAYDMPHVRAVFERAADAAIAILLERLKEPTEAMLEAGERCFWNGSYDYTDELRDAFKAMMTRALSEEGE